VTSVADTRGAAQRRAVSGERKSPAPRKLQAGGRIEQMFFWSLVAGLAWAPFWFGSNDLFAWGLNAVWFCGLAVAYEVSLLIRGASHPVGVRTIGVSAALMGAVFVWILIQNATWTPAGLHHPIWGMAAEALDRPVAGSISVNRDLTTLASMRLVTAVSVFWMSLQSSRNPARAHLLLGAIGVLSCLFAAYGLFAFAVTPMQVLWVKASGGGSVTSTFINRNSYATYAGIGLVTIVAFALRLYRRKVEITAGPAKFRLATFIEATGREGIYLLGAVFLVLVALLLTGSRGGIIATGLGLVILLLLSAQRKQTAPDQRGTIIFVSILIAVAFLVFGDLFLSRVISAGLTDENRLAVYVITLRSIANTPLLGYGYGTFVDIFPMFRDTSISIDGKWSQAHDTYLEIFQGLGVPFGLMLIASVGLLVVRCIKAAGARKESAMVPAVAASVGLLVGVHALVDFSLQIQGITLTFAALLGAGVAQSSSSRVATDD
jgi:O-antigen ligase